MNDFIQRLIALFVLIIVSPLILMLALIIGCTHKRILFCYPRLPGITGLWQVSGRNRVSCHRRIAMNIYYIRHRSVFLDMWIIYKTLWAVIGGNGAF